MELLLTMKEKLRTHAAAYPTHTIAMVYVYRQAQYKRQAATTANYFISSCAYLGALVCVMSM